MASCHQTSDMDKQSMDRYAGRHKVVVRVTEDLQHLSSNLTKHSQTTFTREERESSRPGFMLTGNFQYFASQDQLRSAYIYMIYIPGENPGIEAVIFFGQFSFRLSKKVCSKRVCAICYFFVK